MFCYKYFVHADEVDIRKLISYKFCINSTRHLSESIEDFNTRFGETIRIIDAIIEHVSSLSEDKKTMVDFVKVDVEKYGNIENYWQRKLEMLINIGVVSDVNF